MKQAQLKKWWVVIVLFLAVTTTGCRVFDETLIVHDELFTYDVSYDKAFLKVMDALGELPDWTITNTNKAEGEINLMSMAFSRDEYVTVVLKRVSRTQTTVELAPDSQTVRGVEELLKAIDKVFIK